MSFRPDEVPDRRQASTLVLFVLAALGLLILARSGVPTIVVVIALGVYAVAAVFWIRAQYLDSRDGQIWVLPVKATIGAGLVAAILVGLSVGLHWSWAALAGLYFAWLTGSAALTRLRNRQTERGGVFFKEDSSRTIVGIVTTGAGLFVLLGGIGLLGEGAGWPLNLGLLMIGVAILVLLAIGVNLLSESAIRSVARKGYRWITVAGVIGLVVFAAATAVAWWLSKTPEVVLVFGALFILVVAVVSSTHADAVLMMAVVAVLGVTPPQMPLSVKMTATGGPDKPLTTLVALGDSYMSGEGAEVYYKGTDDGGASNDDHNQCRQAPGAWAATLAEDAQFEAFSFLACSGAATGNVLHDPKKEYPGNVPEDAGARAFAQTLAGTDNTPGLIQPQKHGHTLTQLDRWIQQRDTRNLKPAMVVVSLGGNDVGFATIGATCLAPGNCDEKGRELWLRSLPQVMARLRLTYMEIKETFEGVPVFTVGYPDPISLQDDVCSDATLTVGERKFVREFVLKLNETIQRTSEEFGFRYMPGMQTALSNRRLQLCDESNGGHAGLNFIDLRSVRGEALHRFNPANWYHNTLHPNKAGHEALWQTFAETFSQLGPIEKLAPQRDIDEEAQKRLNHQLTEWQGLIESAARKAAVEERKESVEKAQLKAAPLCDLFESSETGCRAQANDWALEQVKIMLLDHWGFLLLLIGCSGAWVVAVAGAAGLRRRWSLQHGASS